MGDREWILARGVRAAGGALTGDELSAVGEKCSLGAMALISLLVADASAVFAEVVLPGAVGGPTGAGAVVLGPHGTDSPQITQDDTSAGSPSPWGREPWTQVAPCSSLLFHGLVHGSQPWPFRVTFMIK